MARANKKWAPIIKQTDKYKARSTLNTAVKAGDIEKPDVCEGCGKKRKLHGHHEDYSKPLEVKWLCAKCHGKLRRKE